MRNKKFFIILVFVVCFFSACKNKDNIEIAGIFPLSGDYYLDGTDKKYGIELAISQRPNVIGKKINFIYADSKSERIEAINLYNKLAGNRNICGIIDCGNSTLAKDVASVSQKKPLPLIVSTASVEKITSYGKNIFRIACSDKMQGECMAKFALKDLGLKNKTGAVLYNKENNYSVTLAKAFVESFKNSGGKILIQQDYLNSDTDFSLQLNKIAILKPEVLFLPDYTYNVALILDQIKNKNPDLKILGPNTCENIVNQSLDKLFPNQIYFCTNYFYDNPSDKNKAFVKAYEEKYKKKPSAFSALAYDACNIFLDAIEKAQSTKHDDIIKALNEISFDGVIGEVKFDENRNPIRDLNIIEISNGQNKFLKVFDLYD